QRHDEEHDRQDGGRRDEHVLASPLRESRGALPAGLRYDAFTSCQAASKSCVPLAPR
ncbi:MAG: hypothetical protein QOK36_3264, partial [Gaiellales bacterium]|nr:hypothetical protein [Gaiellales bacterium]